MPEIFRPLGLRRNHSKIADPVLTTRLPRKVARDSCPTTLTFPFCGCFRGHGRRYCMELWSNIETALLCSAIRVLSDRSV